MQALDTLSDRWHFQVFLSPHHAMKYCYHNGKQGMSTHTKMTSKNTTHLGVLPEFFHSPDTNQPAGHEDCRHHTCKNRILCLHSQYSVSREEFGEMSPTHLVLGAHLHD